MFVQRFSATPRGARLARLLALHEWDSWGVPYGSRASEEAAAVLAELAANAVVHGRVPGRDFELALDLPQPGTLLIEVTDTRGEALPTATPVPPRSDAESGRGLVLVSALAKDWGVRPRTPVAPGKTVWAHCGCPPGAGRMFFWR
ncbi:ATP-binding protein [Streptomyces diacarni]|uniref:ATP-binding protein n=1 Tax=Streptomyces diacarni TaxID=2800381 RepID=A0A367ETH4_9ACTN|nr:ATP-binding protein [Streptomyces diacarni]RCG21426.1 ATP-binding protein [Streptomyces diacarni]